MEYYEITKSRAQETLPVWVAHLPTLHIGVKTSADLATLIDGFEPLVQARVAAQDDFDAAFRAAQGALGIMKVLGTKVPQLIEGQLSENAAVMKDVDDLFSTQPRAEGTILKRLRELLPTWVRANAALLALSPTQTPIVRTVAGVTYTAAEAATLLNSYTTLVGTIKTKEELLDGCREALRGHDRATDRLNKTWYKVAKATADAGSPLANALDGITTEAGTPAPVVIEIDHVVQGGDYGLQALVSYIAGGGEHATSKTIRWKIEGVDADFTHSAPLDASGNALGPFTVGQVVKLFAEVSNSSGTRTTAVRTITIGPAIV